jgi:hypothetical protein
MRTLFPIVASVALLGFAPAPFPRAPRSNAAPIEIGGIWGFDVYEHRKMRSPSLEQTYRAELAGGRFALVDKAGGISQLSVWEMRVNPATWPPSFTWTMGGRMTHVGSYRLDGHEMTMVFATGQDVSARPTDFGTSPPEGWRFVMRRVKRD